ncbi:28655_t:CDS:2 [Dentiscutata erythropus]|uniref:28655_t:CDS:1 n=1 Tax=Dentiscutata erythropus TaxID=1348616 RepID=A0A9N9BTQ7_9GLOM|nr:28655_t:CDS:2 [Dentiscutata erythropus]
MENVNQVSISTMQPRQPRPRFQFTTQHRTLLEGVYQETPYPDKARKLQLAAQIGATDVQVNEWFQRRRKKDPTMISNRALANSAAAANTALNSTTPAPSTTSAIITIPLNPPASSSSTTMSQGHTNMGAITSPYFSYTSHVNPPIPNHEVYVYIGDNQASHALPITQNTESNNSEKQEEPVKTKSETDNSKELIETIMPYLKTPELGLISSDVVHDFLHKVKDTPLSERGLILTIIDQTKDLDTLKSLVSERAHYLLRNWIIDEAKTPDSGLLLRLLQTVNHLPIDIEALSASGLGKVINNKSVKDSQIEGVSALASLLISKWKEEKKQHDAKLVQEAKLAAASNVAANASKAGVRTSSTLSKTSQTNPSTSKVSKGKEASTRIKLSTESKAKEIDPKLQARPDTNIFDEILGLNTAKPVKPVTKTIKKDQQKPMAVVKVAAEKQDPLMIIGTSKSSSEVIEDGGSSVVKKEQENGQSLTIKEAKKDIKVKIFEEEYDEMEGEFSAANTPHQFGNARDLDRNEGLTAFKRVRKAPAIQWYTASMLDLTNKKIIKPATVESDEARIQEERERQILETIYITSDQVPFSPAEPDENIQQNRNNITSQEIILNAESDEEDIEEDIGDNDSESRPFISEELFTQLLDIYTKWQAMQQNPSVFSSNMVGIETKTLVNNLPGIPIPSQLPTTQQQPTTWNFEASSIINYHQPPPPSGIQPPASQQPIFPQQYPTNNMPNQPPTYQYSNFFPPANQNKEFYPQHKEPGLPQPQPTYNGDSPNRPYTEPGFGRQSQQPQASTVGRSGRGRGGRPRGGGQTESGRPVSGRGSECWYFKSGRCNLGDDCKFLHVDYKENY